MSPLLFTASRRNTLVREDSGCRKLWKTGNWSLRRRTLQRIRELCRLARVYVCRSHLKANRARGIARCTMSSATSSSAPSVIRTARLTVHDRHLPQTHNAQACLVLSDDGEDGERDATECFKHALVINVFNLTQVPNRYCCALGALRKCAYFFFLVLPHCGGMSLCALSPRD